MYMFETACNIQIRAQSGGVSLSFVPPELLAGARAQAAAATQSLGGKLVWPGLLRMLDGIDSSYAT
jgi:hypothetical protein